MRATLLSFAILSAMLLLLLAQATSNSAQFTATYPWLLGINGVVGIILLGVVVRQLRGLWRDWRAAVFGSRLKARLLIMFSIMAVLPGALVYAVSMQFAVKSIDSWFDVRVDAALEGGLNLGRSVLDTLQDDALDKARNIASALGDGGNVSVSQLDRLRDQVGAQTALVLTPAGHVIAASSGDLGSAMPSLPAPAQLRAARGGRGIATISEFAPSTDSGQTFGRSGGLMLRALVPLRGARFALEPNVLQVTQTVPESLAESATSVEAAHRDYQELQLGREGLKRIYTLTLTLTLLLALVAAVALAFFFAERIARPLLILAEGTRAVAAGDFTPRATVEAKDELGILTHSFNSMTQQLGDARRETERHRVELESAQTYLESVLANLSAGVLAFDARYKLRAANKGAMNILADPLDGFEALQLAEWPRQTVLANIIVEGFETKGLEWTEQIEIQRDDGRPQALLLRGTALPASGGGGFVVVFDDITHLIAAQRSAAWGEVAQRLAHEIKNPLTPIQLSAERLQMKLADRLDVAGQDLLLRATRTIVNQVEAMKNMVNDFREYARTPPPQLAVVDLPALLEDVLHLYDNSPVKPRISAVPPAPTFVLADMTQLRQVLHNLITNAQDALIEVAGGAIDLALAIDGQQLRLTITDNGGGFPPQILSRAFEPYVTTKSRGTGLGLAIVKKIIDDHHGRIALANRPQGGGEVSVWLALAPRGKTEGEA